MLASSNAGRLLGEAHTLYTLLFEYTLALFLIGHLVCECGWSACSGEVAHTVLQYCYVTLTDLLYKFRYNVEYLRTLGTTLQVWDKWYDNLPGRCDVEESCEALLARLVATVHANPQCKSLDTACDLFLILKAARSHEENLHDLAGLAILVACSVHGSLAGDSICCDPAPLMDQLRPHPRPHPILPL